MFGVKSESTQGRSGRFSFDRYNYEAQLGPAIDDLMADLRSMLLSGRYVLTAEVSAFESAFAAYSEAKFCAGVNCGTDALVLAMRALGIGPGDEVVTQANTFHATVAAIEIAGATPVLVDAHESTFLLDQAQLPPATTARTKAVIPVHLFGKPTPMPDVLAFARQRGLKVIEDAAQAHGARFQGQRVGSWGDAACFSFHPSKNLAAAGDGGAVVTNDPAVADSLRLLRFLGQREQNDHVVVGFNSKLDSIQARILSAKLPFLDRWNDRRRQLASYYREAMAELPVGFQAEDPGEEHVYHLFQIRTRERDRLLAHLIARGVDAVVRYPVPIHLQPAFSHRGWRRGQFPVAEALAQELLCLPIRPDMSEADVAAISDCVRSFFDDRSR